jgi:hypothetical protein
MYFLDDQARMDDETTEQTVPRQSGWQFSMRAMLVLLAIVCAALAVFVRFYLVGLFCAAFLAGLALVGYGVAHKRTGLLGAGSLLASASLIVLMFGATKALWVGQSLVSLTFVVVDDQSGRPVSGATVRLRELPFESGIPSLVISPNEPGVEMRTSPRGRATITYKFSSTGQSGLLVRTTATAQILEDYYVQTSAEGYQTQVVPLYELTGHNVDLTWPQQPPPIRIRLERASTPDASDAADAEVP